MRGRGLLIFLATLVVLLSALSSLRTSSATKPAPSGVSAVMPADPKVKLAPGEELTLQIRSASPDVAAISELGLEVPVGPDVPGEILLIAPSSGSFDVTLQVAKRKVGEIVVRD
jgi:hypothetical protein